MATAIKRTGWVAGCAVIGVAGAIWCLLPSVIGAAVVVQPSGETQDTTAEELPGLPDWAIPSQEPSAEATPSKEYQPKAPAQPGAQPAQPVRGQAPPQTMPVPPTYAPGTPAGTTAPSSAGLPPSPTGFGLWDPNSQPSAFGQPSPGPGLAPTGPGPGQAGAAPGGMGFGPPPQPTRRRRVELE